jgi:DDE family transposase
VRLVATVVGQDLVTDEHGCFRIVRKVAADRVISTVDPEARQHKTAARGFDGYKGHIAIDPDSEIITATAVTAGNSGDAEVAQDLLTDILPSEAEAEAEGQGEGQAAVYGDAAYGAGELLARLDNDVHNGLKVQPPSRVKGHFGKDQFDIDLDAQTVTCPAGTTAMIRPVNSQRHAGVAEFATACATCPLAAQCTTATAGRTITIGHYEAELAAGRARQADPCLEGRLPGHPTQSRTQDRPPDAPPPRRTPRPGPRPDESSRRLLIAGCRDQRGSRRAP